MKRVGGRVTWLCEFDGRRADLAACGNKRTTLRRCHTVAPGDTLRLSSGGDAGVFAEVTVRRVRPITIGIGTDKGCLSAWAELNGAEMTRDGLDVLAVADGFEGAVDMLEWLAEHDKFFAGLYDGQLIEW